jgi:hypothetical protein
MRIWNDKIMDFISSPKKAKDWNLARCSASSFIIAGAATVAFVDLNLS